MIKLNKIIILFAIIVNILIQTNMARTVSEPMNISQKKYLSKRNDLETLKATVELYLDYQELLKEPALNNSAGKKMTILGVYNKLKNKITAFMNESNKNKAILTKIIAQVILEKQSRKKSEKEVSASNDINSITGFWGK